MTTAARDDIVRLHPQFIPAQRYLAERLWVPDLSPRLQRWTIQQPGRKPQTSDIVINGEP
jgi:hypothetical protein